MIRIDFELILNSVHDLVTTSNFPFSDDVHSIDYANPPYTVVGLGTVDWWACDDVSVLTDKTLD